jgi:hypothetical protein
MSDEIELTPEESDALAELYAQTEGQGIPEGTDKVPEASAGYMELEGAVKDGDCKIVYVEGGISKDLGCCDLFRHAPSKEKRFSCGTCKYESAN